MTVAELIQKLQELPADMPVAHWRYYPHPVTAVSVESTEEDDDETGERKQVQYACIEVAA